MQRNLIVAALALLLTGCTTLSDTASVFLTDAGDSPDADMANNNASPCAEADVDACARLGLDCGVHSIASVCGETQTVACGTCADPESCGGSGTEGVCGCIAEADDEFCAGAGRDCGTVAATDRCGVERSIECGTCATPTVCGQEEPNVCGCPCRIDGVCRADDMANPDNPCERCDPATSTTEWSFRAGDCDDDDMCTTNDACDAGTGLCVGEDVQCTPATDQCEESVCDSSTGECGAAPVADGMPCTGDQYSCTIDRCVSGVCESTLLATNCVIDGQCYSTTFTNPANDCEECRPSADPRGWSPKIDGDSCEDNDAFVCTVGSCQAGSCIATITNNCLIDGVCHAPGTSQQMMPCSYCDPVKDRTQWSPRPVGFLCRPGTSADCKCTSAQACEDQAIGAICL